MPSSFYLFVYFCGHGEYAIGFEYFQLSCLHYYNDGYFMTDAQFLALAALTLSPPALNIKSIRGWSRGNGLSLV